MPSATASCSDNYGMLFGPIPDAWTQVTVTFADKTTFTQSGWGVVVPTFDPANILNVQFQVDGTTTATAAAPYNFAIDDVAFF